MVDLFIVDVNDYDFETEVISYSQNKPVVVEFWASWSKPCRQIDPLLEKITRESQGAFRLARVNVDDSPNLALQFSIHSVPTVKVFSGRQVVSEFVNVPSEEKVREFLRAIRPPDELTLALERAEGFFNDHRWQEAFEAYQHCYEANRNHAQATLGLIKSCLVRNMPAAALELIRTFPASKLYQNAQRLKQLALAMEQTGIKSSRELTDQDLAFERCIYLVGKGNLLAAMDGLMDLLRADRNFHAGQARACMLALLELWGDEASETRQYRTELASILF